MIIKVVSRIDPFDEHCEPLFQHFPSLYQVNMLLFKLDNDTVFKHKYFLNCFTRIALLDKTMTFRIEESQVAFVSRMYTVAAYRKILAPVV